MFLVRGVYIVVLLLSKRASDYNFFGIHQVTLRTHLLIIDVSGVPNFLNEYQNIRLRPGS